MFSMREAFLLTRLFIFVVVVDEGGTSLSHIILVFKVLTELQVGE